MSFAANLGRAAANAPTTLPFLRLGKFYEKNEKTYKHSIRRSWRNEMNELRELHCKLVVSALECNEFLQQRTLIDVFIVNSL